MEGTGNSAGLFGSEPNVTSVPSLTPSPSVSALVGLVPVSRASTNAPVPVSGKKQLVSHTDLAKKNAKNTPEFFILSDLYSEALVIFLA